MMNDDKGGESPFRVMEYTLTLVAAWTLAVLVSLTWGYFGEQAAARHTARVAAETQLAKDLLYRRWNAGHGGVYVPESESTPANPYLTEVLEREVETPSGRLLTLVNPAYMTRQVYALGQGGGVRGHITSLNPIRPRNAPDAWERRALELFEEGASEYSSIEMLDGEPHLRHMHVFKTEQVCLKCHAKQGYQEGDVRGGISISTPMAPYLAIAWAQIGTASAGHAALWLLGLGVLAFGARRIRRHAGELDRTQVALFESEERYRGVAEDTPVLLCRFLPGGKITYANEACCKYFGRERAALTGTSFFSLIPEEDREPVLANTSALTVESPTQSHEHRVIAAGDEIRWQRWTSRAVFGGLGRPVAYQAIGEDITERKRAEEELRQYAYIASCSLDMQALLDTHYVYLAANASYLQAFGKTREGVIGRTAADVFGPEFFDTVIEARAARCLAGEEVRYQDWFDFPASGRKYMDIAYSPYLGPEGEIRGFAVTSRDITARKRAEEAREVHLRFLEKMARVDGAVQQARDVEQMMSDVLEEVLAIFECDRAWLLHPCDPETLSFRVAMERTRAAYPGGAALDAEIPLQPEVAQEFAEALDVDDVVEIYPHEPDAALEICERFSILAQMHVVVRPRTGKAWLFGVHQCSRERVWGVEEKDLFREIGHRLGDGLSSLLFMRDLREGEERYRRITRAVTDYIYTVRVEDGQAAETTHGEACFAVTGYTREEFHADAYLWINMVPEEDRARVRLQAERVLRDEAVEPLEHRIVRKDGEERWVVNSAVPERDDEGRLVSYDGLVQDITARKRAEEEALKETAFSDAAIACLPGIFYVFDEHGRFLRWNRNLETVSGYSGDEIAGMLPESFFSSEQQGGLNEAIHKAFAEGWSSVEASVVGKDGVATPHFLTGARFETNGLRCLVGMGLDISERSRAEGALRESERSLREAQRIAHIGNWSQDLVTGAITWSDEMFAVMGCARQEVTFAWVTSLIHPEDLPRLGEAARLAAAGQRSTDIDFRIVRPDGEIRHIQDRWESFYDEAGKEVRQVGTIQDFTERHRAGEAREQLEVQLRQAQKMEAVGQLAGGVAHDFNNLLQAILGYGDLALDHAGTDPSVRAPVEGVLKAGKRAATLVRQLLAFSRRQVLEMQDVDLNEVIGDLMKMIRRVIGEHIDLETVFSQDLGTVRADPGQIEQILMNLCVNARDAMPDGGSITIETENAEIGEEFCVSHRWAIPGHYALLSVTDTGHGMDEATAGQIFEPFFTTKGVGEGTGLGLATVYGLVKQHQGMVHVYSEVGKGTSFKIYLPLVERSATVAGARIEGPVPGGTETVLLAEDDAMVCELTKDILGQAGYRVLSAADGEEALRIFDEHAGEIDLALLDVMMPKLGGRAVFERIREQRPRVRVLFASGYSMNAIHTNFVLDEGLSLIRKPFQRDDLLRKVREVLDDRVEEAE